MKCGVFSGMTALLLGAACLFGAEAPAAESAGEAGSWSAIGKEAFQGETDANFNPDMNGSVVFADRTTGEAFLSGWVYGVWKSADGGKTFSKVDGGKLSGPQSGPFFGNCVHMSPEGKKIAIFNMWNQPGPSGYSVDGGQTWVQFGNSPSGRDWDFGAMDWDSKVVLAALHESEGIMVSTNAGSTWTQVPNKLRYGVPSKGEPGCSGLGVVGNVLFYSTWNSIQRSEDTGKSWTKVSDLGANGTVLNFNDKLWCLGFEGPSSYWEGAKRIITSSDQGKTWTTVGSPLPDRGVIGPLFGKDENHMVMAGLTGFYETTDGCKTWKLVAALPEGYKLGEWLQSAAFDPVHNVFYLENRHKPVMKYERGGSSADASKPAATKVEAPKPAEVKVEAPKPAEVKPSDTKAPVSSSGNQKAALVKPAWASEVGNDRFGTWAKLVVGGQTQVMRLIPAGRFQMGAEDRGGDEKPVHQVELTQPFWLGDSEVSQGLWQAVMGSNPSKFTGDATRPVEQVTWDECTNFFQRLNGQVQGLRAGFPTEAQWEYACRAGSTGDFAGDIKAMAWINENSGEQTHPVKTKLPNAWGLYDMHGNVYEAIADGYRAANYTAEAQRDPFILEGCDRIRRGGCFRGPPDWARTTNRCWWPPSTRQDELGLRFVIQATP